MEFSKQNSSKAPKNKFMFYSEKEFDYFTSFVSEYYSVLINFTILLYRIDIVKSKTNDIYGESRASEKKFLTPVELNIAIDTLEHETFFVSKEGMFNESLKEFKFGILLDELKVKDCKDKINPGFLYGYLSETDNLFLLIRKNQIAISTALLSEKDWIKFEKIKK